ncbi:MAG TPA: hypothetical protein VGA37_06150 [Gemmatimonadales bacterium]
MDEFVLFHRTTVGEATQIVKRGFTDEKWGFEVRDDRTGRQVKMVGVWLADRPLGSDEGPEGDAVLEVRISVPESSLTTFELDGLFWDARLWVVPSALLNPHVRVRILEVDPRTSWWYEAPREEE